MIEEQGDDLKAVVEGAQDGPEKSIFQDLMIEAEMAQARKKAKEADEEQGME